MQPQILSRTFPPFIHYNHGSGSKNLLFDSPCNQSMCGTMSGDGSYYEVSNEINYYNFEASYWIRGLVLSGKNVGKT